MSKEFEYDKYDPVSIESYATELIGKTFRNVYELDAATNIDSNIAENKKNKGNLGQLIERHWFHYECNSDSNPDFKEAGVELKVSPYKYNKDGSVSAKERLILTKIDYFQIVKESFEESHMWNKSKLILLIYYLYSKEVKIRLDYEIRYVKLFTPPQQDILIIQHDYQMIVEKVRQGKAHELSEADTLYLGAATKSATSKDRTSQPYSTEQAKPRAFCFKQSYMSYVLNHYILSGEKTYEPILKNKTTDSFEDYVVEEIGKYRGFSVDDLIHHFEISLEKKPKNLQAMLTFRMLGVKSNNAEEFIKAGIAIKTIRVTKKKSIKENMSFPTFKFKELAKEKTWENSTFGNYLRETRFLFVVYKEDEQGVLRLRGCQFWKIPNADLEVEVRSVWEKMVNVLNTEVKIAEVNGKITNNFPKSTENRVAHVRPHGKNSKDTSELPDGRYLPKQCFWLNKSYILSQLDKDLID